MIRRRLLIAAAVALAAAGTLGAGAATAESDTTVTGVRAASGDYIACAGVRTINVAFCVEEPIGPLFERLP